MQITDSKANRQIRLHDGRMLGYAEYGDPGGTPVFYFHGFPTSRLEWLLIDPDDVAMDLNARIVAVDRPGSGLSDFKPGLELLDWPDDVTELADGLELDRFAVLGGSGGAPFAAACAFRIPAHLTAVGIVCGMGPGEAPGMKEGLSWTLPGKSSLPRRLSLWLTAVGLRKDPDKVLSRFREMVSEPDRKLLDQPEVAKVFIHALGEAFRVGYRGANQDAALYAGPWRFPLQDITADVHLWHGEQDLNVPVSVGRYVGEIILNCHAAFFEDEGHLSLPRNHIREILGALLA